MKLLLLLAVYLAHGGWFDSILGKGPTEASNKTESGAAAEGEDSEVSEGKADGEEENLLDETSASTQESEESQEEAEEAEEHGEEHMEKEHAEEEHAEEEHKEEEHMEEHKEDDAKNEVEPREESKLREKLTELARYHTDPTTAVDLKLYMSSNCPYSQDFCMRHLSKVLYNNDMLPTHLTIIPRFSNRDFVGGEGTCQVCGEGSMSDRQGCLGNLAMAIMQSESLDVDQKLIADQMENTVNLFQQAPFNQNIHKLDLWEESFQGSPQLEELRPRVKRRMENCPEARSLIQDMITKFQQGKEEASEQSEELGGPRDLHHIFPFLFIAGQFIPLHHGILYAEGFGMAKLKTLVCTVSPQAPACEGKEIEDYSLGFKGSDLMVSFQNFVLVASVMAAATAFVFWFRSIHPQHTNAEVTSAFLDEELHA